MHITDYDGVDVTYDGNCVPWGYGDGIDGVDIEIEITHLDDMEVAGPFSLVPDLNEPYAWSTDSSQIAKWIAEQLMEAA